MNDFEIEETKKAVIQLRMAIGCTIVKIEEWSLFAQIMRWHATVIAERLGYTLAEMRDAVKAGKISGCQIQEALAPHDSHDVKTAARMRLLNTMLLLVSTPEQVGR